MKKLVAICLSGAFLAACQSYRYQSIPHDMQLSPISCSTQTQELRLRQWTEDNEGWLKRALTPGFGAEVPAKRVYKEVSPTDRNNYLNRQLREFDNKLADEFFSGCVTNYTTSAVKDNFWKDFPASGWVTTKIAFIEDHEGRRLWMSLHANPKISGTRSGEFRTDVSLGHDADSVCIQSPVQ